MGDSQGKQRTGYNTWSVEESSILLELMVDAANRGWRSTNGVLSRQTVEKKILPILIFKSAPPFPFRTQAELVLACAGLHNFLRKECRSDEFPVEPDNEASSPSSPSLAGFEEDEDVFETQEQQREHANEWRINIASEMWDDHERCE
ncbi:putative harbinger transposase-derived nuclease [Abeliophyllum distichum]|uniref:Harbinger transposase-derived nuclease n=1 Tax=Abeliophyllum distichum TaxID=126358 RepID=A0ABD1VAE2_9LAMI